MNDNTTHAFTATRRGHGTQEWSDQSFNFQTGCQHGCVYCYAKQINARFPGVRIADWTRPIIRQHDVQKTWKQCRKDKIVMFPTSHDIHPDNVDIALDALRKMLVAGYGVLVVSKPHAGCIQQICREFAGYTQQMMFRFTIGSLNESILAVFEPFAPPASERLDCLRYAFQHGFQTSVSTEPLLGGLDTARAILAACLPYLTHDLWIGKLNKIGRFTTPALAPYLATIQEEQTDAKILTMYEALRIVPQVHWKDSIQAVIRGADGDES